MAGTRDGLRDRWTMQGRGVTFMSPQALKERLKSRCMEHMKKNRKRILENLRHQSSDVPSEVMDMSESVCLENMVSCGEITQDDYFEILTSLESALREEMKNAELEFAEELLEAEEAWITDFQELDLHNNDTMNVYVLCPICKKHGISFHDSTMNGETLSSCKCGFTLRINTPRGKLDASSHFQDSMSNAYEAHQCMCDEDPQFRTSTMPSQFDSTSEAHHLYLDCGYCGSFMIVI